MTQTVSTQPAWISDLTAEQIKAINDFLEQENQPPFTQKEIAFVSNIIDADPLELRSLLSCVRGEVYLPFSLQELLNTDEYAYAISLESSANFSINMMILNINLEPVSVDFVEYNE